MRKSIPLKTGLSNLGNFFIIDGVSSCASVSKSVIYRSADCGTDSHPVALYRRKSNSLPERRNTFTTQDASTNFLCMWWLNCPLIASMYSSQFRYSTRLLVNTDMGLGYHVLRRLKIGFNSRLV